MSIDVEVQDEEDRIEVETSAIELEETSISESVEEGIAEQIDDSEEEYSEAEEVLVPEERIEESTTSEEIDEEEEYKNDEEVEEVEEAASEIELEIQQPSELEQLLIEMEESDNDYKEFEARRKKIIEQRSSFVFQIHVIEQDINSSIKGYMDINERKMILKQVKLLEELRAELEKITRLNSEIEEEVTKNRQQRAALIERFNKAIGRGE